MQKQIDKLQDMIIIKNAEILQLREELQNKCENCLLVKHDKNKHYDSYKENTEKELLNLQIILETIEEHLTFDFLTMSNNDFFKKHGFNWIPPMPLQHKIKTSKSYTIKHRNNKKEKFSLD